MIELKKHSDAVVMSAVVKNPLNYGRIIRNGERFSKIVEEKDATDEQRQICEINAGTYPEPTSLAILCFTARD